MHLEGKGRNEIAEILNSSHTRISQGSVTNILRTYKGNTGEASTTTDFLKAPKPSPTSSQLQTSSTSMKEKVQIPVSEGPEGQEPLSIEDSKGLEVPIALATSTPTATATTSSSFPFPVPEALPYSAGVNSYSYLYSHSQVNMGLANRRTLSILPAYEIQRGLLMKLREFRIHLQVRWHQPHQKFILTSIHL